MKNDVEILSNLSTDCKPVTLTCSAEEALQTWLDVTSFRERMHLELVVEPLKSGGCIVYLEDWTDFPVVDDVDNTPYISIIFICLFLGAIICLN